MPILGTRSARFGTGEPPRKLGRALASVAVIVLLTQAAALAQLPMGGTVVENATVLVGDGTRLTNTSILISGDRIGKVGADVSGGMMATKIDARGKVITPGLIDVWSSLGVYGGGANPAERVADAFDAYDKFALRAALRNGVTVIYGAPAGGESANGVGAVVHLNPGVAGAAELLRREGDLGGALGGGAIGSVMRWQEMRDAFRAALDYRDAREDYEEELEEYKERIDKAVKAYDAAQAEEKKEGDAKGENGGEAKDGESKPTKPGEDGERKPNKSGKDAGGDEKEGEDDLKKPAEPRPEPEKDRLLEVLDGGVRMRVAADQPRDLLNLLDLGREFNLPLVIEGASGAAHVAAELADAGVPVILDATQPALRYTGVDARRFARADTIRVLRDAGVDVYLASGRGGHAATPRLSLIAAQAVAQGVEPADALAMITSRAAELLRIEEDYGQVAPGKVADLVIWSGPPFRSGSRVERVFVSGKEVFNAERDSGEDW